ncbi:MAG: PIN domain-containing protein [Oscillospiraceae bacterium]|nr:PIN domain-containing protein [Oscillospiraceae bacterium]MCL2278100.1 PIN domain-containing protein [Oscillospiraceae bacterium]
MNVLIDTNVVLDQLVRREPFYENAERIRLLSEKGYINSYISASAITDIYYIAKKELKDKNVVVKLIEKLLETSNIAAVTESSIHEALGLKWDDFEDAVQYSAGQNISASYIITRNPNDFRNSRIEIVSPEEFLSIVTDG